MRASAGGAVTQDDILQVMEDDNCSTASEAQLADDFIDRDLKATEAKYNVTVKHQEQPSVTWTITDNTTNLVKGSVYRLSSTTLRATCKCKHNYTKSNGERFQCQLILTSRNSIGTAFYDVIEWLAQGVSGLEHAGAHEDLGNEYKRKHRSQKRPGPSTSRYLLQLLFPNHVLPICFG